MNKYTVWDYINQICDKSDKIEFDSRIFNSYITAIHFSQDKNLIEIVNKIMPYIFTLDSKVVYNYFYNKIPKGKRWIKWPKKIKEKTIKEMESLKEELNLSDEEILKYKNVIEFIKENK